MKSVKTITCHKVYNYGASLQEFALIKFLQNLGFNAKAINYKPDYLSGHHSLWSISNPKFSRFPLNVIYIILKFPKRLIETKRKKNFDAFHKKYIPETTTIYFSNDELKKNPPPADAYICGSDQIWNFLFHNGKDPAFYLDFVPENKLKLSYAASFATDEFPQHLAGFLYENLKNLHYISVRETSALDILDKLSIRNGVRVLDPVFLLEPEFWVKEFVEPIPHNFVFVYDFDTNPLIRQIAIQLKKNLGWKIFSVNKNIKYTDKNYYLSGPGTFLSLIYHAKMVITNSYHGLAFSLIFKKNFWIVLREENINARMIDLMKLLQVQNRMLTRPIEKNQLLEPVDFQALGKKLEEEKLLSREFLSNTLNQHVKS